jgi:hypothetical protein
MADPTEITDHREQELLCYRKACEALWPAIRFFGVSGAAPQYVASAMEIGRLLGHVKAENASPASLSANVNLGEIIERTRSETIEQVADWVKNAPEVRGIAGRSRQEEFAKMIGQLKGE